MFAWYRELIRIRRTIPAFRTLDLSQQRVASIPGTSALMIRRFHESGECLIIANFTGHDEKVTLSLPELKWSLLLNSDEDQWDGSGNEPPSIVLTHGSVEMTLPRRALLVYYGKSQP
jgi:maltooligosyltrehalose trehalohydrolase